MELQTSFPRCRVALICNDIWLLSVPSIVNEKVIDDFRRMITMYNSRCDGGRGSYPLRGIGSARVRYGPGVVLEADCAYFNQAIPSQLRAKDAKGAEIPNLVFEVGFQKVTKVFVRHLSHTSNATRFRWLFQ